MQKVVLQVENTRVIKPILMLSVARRTSELRTTRLDAVHAGKELVVIHVRELAVRHARPRAADARGAHQHGLFRLEEQHLLAPAREKPVEVGWSVAITYVFCTILHYLED